MKRVFVLLFLAINILFLGCQSSNISEIPITYKEDHIIVMAELNGVSMRMIWDTGCSGVFINHDVVGKINATLSADSSCVGYMGYDTTGVHKNKGELSKFFYHIRQTDKYARINPIDITIGHLQFNLPAIVEPTIGSSYVSGYDGIIGGSIINSCYWSLDLQNNKLFIADKPIYIDTSKIKKSIHINFKLVTNRPLCHVTMNDSVDCVMLWDTGMPGFDRIHKDDKPIELLYDFMFMKTNVSLQQENTIRSLWDSGSSFTVFSNGVANQFTCHKKLKINESIIDSFIVFTDNEVDEYQGYISLAFARRFSEVVYNPTDKTISMYLYDGDNRALTDQDFITPVKSLTDGMSLFELGKEL